MAKLLTTTFSKNAKKVIVLSGCDSGLGYSLARRCMDEGLKVVAGCLQLDSSGSKTLRDVGADVIHLDITKDHSVSAAVKVVEKILQSDGFELQAAVNNAGVMVFGEFEWQTPRLMQQQVQVNLVGSFNMAHAFLPLLQQHEGRLINIVSHCALAGLPGLSIYGATKAGLLNWSDCLRIEQAKYGVKVISVIPGSFFGESNIMAKQADYAEEMSQKMSEARKSYHGKYFNDFQKYLSQIPRPREPVTVSDEILYRKIMHALLGPNPHPTYRHEPLRYSIYHTLFKLSPISIRDWLVERFVSLPKYNKIIHRSKN